MLDGAGYSEASLKAAWRNHSNQDIAAGVIAYILERRIHPQHGFRACLGILRLGKQHGEARLEAACQRALALGACSYKSLESILRQGLEKLPLSQQNLPLLPDEHINLRGPGYYH